MHLRSTPIKNRKCLTESVECIHAFVMNGDGNPIVEARYAVVGFLSCCEKETFVTGLLYQAYVGPLESYVFDSRDISGIYVL